MTPSNALTHSVSTAATAKLAMLGKNVGEIYSTMMSDPRTKANVAHSFSLLAALDSSVDVFDTTYRTLDELVQTLQASAEGEGNGVGITRPKTRDRNTTGESDGDVDGDD